MHEHTLSTLNGVHVTTVRKYKRHPTYKAY